MRLCILTALLLCFTFCSTLAQNEAPKVPPLGPPRKDPKQDDANSPPSSSSEANPNSQNEEIVPEIAVEDVYLLNSEGEMGRNGMQNEEAYASYGRDPPGK